MGRVETLNTALKKQTKMDEEDRKERGQFCGCVFAQKVKMMTGKYSLEQQLCFEVVLCTAVCE